MQTLILFSTNTGTTKKVAEYIKSKINDEAIIIDVNAKQTYDVSEFENVVFGANVRMFRISSVIKRTIKKLKNKIIDKKVFIYICGADDNKASKYVDKMQKLLPNADVHFVWGEVNPENATSNFDRSVLQSVLDSRHKSGLPEIGVKYSEVDKIIEGINSHIK